MPSLDQIYQYFLRPWSPFFVWRIRVMRGFQEKGYVCLWRGYWSERGSGRVPLAELSLGTGYIRLDQTLEQDTPICRSIGRTLARRFQIPVILTYQSEALLVLYPYGSV